MYLTASAAADNIAVMPKRPEKMLTVSEVAARLGESERNVRNWARGGLFPGAFLQESPRGPYWLVPEGDLRSFSKPARGRPARPKPNNAEQKMKKGAQ